MESLHCFLIDVKNMRAQAVDVMDGLQGYYRLLDCYSIDIQTRKVCGKSFDFICNDEALMVQGARTSAVTTNLEGGLEPMFFGSLLVTGVADENGRQTSLTETDVNLLKRRLIRGITKEGVYPIIGCDCIY